jgi:hypothetical protein
MSIASQNGRRSNAFAALAWRARLIGIALVEAVMLDIEWNGE